MIDKWAGCGVGDGNGDGDGAVTDAVGSVGVVDGGAFISCTLLSTNSDVQQQPPMLSYLILIISYNVFKKLYLEGNAINYLINKFLILISCYLKKEAIGQRKKA